MIEAIKAFEGGYCRQLLAMVDRRSLQMVRFQAVFFALRHKREGWVLVDTGYGNRFMNATDHFPGRFYRWVTPTTPVGSTATMLESAGIKASEIRHLILTHFHADHIGGLAEFPNACVHYHCEALLPLQGLPVWRQVKAAFLAQLIPEWLTERACPISASAFSPTSSLPFTAHDLLGDGSILLVSLPGHAPGQIGIAFTGRNGRELYTADAYWRFCQISAEVEPLPLAMSFQWDPTSYRKTIQLLRTVHRERAYRLTACHDEGACSHLNDASTVA